VRFVCAGQAQASEQLVAAAASSTAGSKHLQVCSVLWEHWAAVVSFTPAKQTLQGFLASLRSGCSAKDLDGLLAPLAASLI
jgi:hypothetical protein